jgi:hypothetical protein
MELDHLVVAARTLEEGTRYIENLLGVATQPGGQHARMGTHNRLLNLGGGVYLEIIAVDPDGGNPFQPRWFALDSPAMRERLAEGPKLIHWVARTRQIEQDVAASVVPLGAIHPMARGDFKWRITIPADGSRPAEGVVPTLIQWDVDDHPTWRLPDSGCALQALRATHPDAANLGSLPFIEVHPGPVATLQAVITTPRGIATLAS